MSVSREHLADLPLQWSEVLARQLRDDAQHRLDLSHGCSLLALPRRIEQRDVCYFLTHIVAVINDLVDSMLGVLGRLA